jgi:DNA polymerase III alpha subunit (gram-positive type)
MNAKYIAFDCETTGVDERCNLLTVSFVILNKNLDIMDTLNLSLKHNFGYFIYPKALEINHIDIVKHHDNSLELIDARHLLLDFLSKYKVQYNLIPIGHNISFDIKFIIISGLLTQNEYSRYISCNPIDTISIAQFLKLSGKLPEKQSISLVNLCNYFKLNKLSEINLQHTAEYDIKMTIKLLQQFKKIMKQNNTHNCTNTPIDDTSSKKRKIELN